LVAESPQGSSVTERPERNTARIGLLEEALEEVRTKQEETSEKLTNVQKKQETQSQQIQKRQTAIQVKKLITANQSQPKDSEEAGDSVQEQIEQLTETTIALREELARLQQEVIPRRAVHPPSSQGLQSDRGISAGGPMADKSEQWTDKERQLHQQLQAERAHNMQMQSVLLGSPQPAPMLLDPGRYQSARSTQAYGAPLLLPNLGYGRPY
jgi:hypothetical protein